MYIEIWVCNYIYHVLADGCSLYVNCGGNDQDNGKVLYEGDETADGSAATRYESTNNPWGFSSTGDFQDDDNDQNIAFVETLESVPSPNIPRIYTTARISPLSLTYFRYCLENGSYNVSLHFAEIQFTSDNTSSSLGRRIFDIYVQVITQMMSLHKPAPVFFVF